MHLPSFEAWLALAARASVRTERGLTLQKTAVPAYPFLVVQLQKKRYGNASPNTPACATSRSASIFVS